MEYRVTMLVRVLEPYCSVEDLERELELFNGANKGLIEVTEVETELLEPIPERHE